MIFTHRIKCNLDSDYSSAIFLSVTSHFSMAQRLTRFQGDASTAPPGSAPHSPSLYLIRLETARGRTRKGYSSRNPQVGRIPPSPYKRNRFCPVIRPLLSPSTRYRTVQRTVRSGPNITLRVKDSPRAPNILK